MWLGGLRRRLPWLLMLLKVCMAVMLDERLKGLSGAVASDLYNAVYACTTKRNIVVVITGRQIKAKRHRAYTQGRLQPHLWGLQKSAAQFPTHLIASQRPTSMRIFMQGPPPVHALEA